MSSQEEAIEALSSATIKINPDQEDTLKKVVAKLIADGRSLRATATKVFGNAEEGLVELEGGKSMAKIQWIKALETGTDSAYKQYKGDATISHEEVKYTNQELTDMRFFENGKKKTYRWKGGDRRQTYVQAFSCSRMEYGVHDENRQVFVRGSVG